MMILACPSQGSTALSSPSSSSIQQDPGILYDLSRERDAVWELFLWQFFERSRVR
jgi:hypothetical protein